MNSTRVNTASGMPYTVRLYHSSTQIFAQVVYNEIIHQPFLRAAFVVNFRTHILTFPFIRNHVGSCSCS